MNNINNYNQDRLSAEDIYRIKKAASNKKMFFRIKSGFISLVKNPFKAVIALLYAVSMIMLYMQHGRLINDLLKNSIWRFIAQMFPEVFRGIFTYGIPVVAVLIFLLLMGFFGIPFGWVGRSVISAGKAEDAFLSAGIYTKAGKLPWLLSIRKSKETSFEKILEIFMNGNGKLEFEAKTEKIQSELGVKIKKFESKGTQRILMYVIPDKVKTNKNSRVDKNF